MLTDKWTSSTRSLTPLITFNLAGYFKVVKWIFCGCKQFIHKKWFKRGKNYPARVKFLANYRVFKALDENRFLC